MFVAYHFDPHSTTNHPTSPSSDPLPCSVSPTGSAFLRTWLRSSLAVSPTCLAESCSLALRTGCLALGCSRPCLAASPLLCASWWNGGRSDKRQTWETCLWGKERSSCRLEGPKNRAEAGVRASVVAQAS